MNNYRLKEAREEAGKSQQQTANYLNTTQMQISKYENGHQDLTLKRAIELADYYGCSLDYLAGRTDKREINS